MFKCFYTPEIVTSILTNKGKGSWAILDGSVIGSSRRIWASCYGINYHTASLTGTLTKTSYPSYNSRATFYTSFLELDLSSSFDLYLQNRIQLTRGGSSRYFYSTYHGFYIWSAM